MNYPQSAFKETHFKLPTVKFGTASQIQRRGKRVVTKYGTAVYTDRGFTRYFCWRYFVTRRRRRRRLTNKRGVDTTTRLSGRSGRHASVASVVVEPNHRRRPNDRDAASKPTETETAIRVATDRPSRFDVLLLLARPLARPRDPISTVCASFTAAAMI